jgi:translation elongation factor EF-G
VAVEVVRQQDMAALEKGLAKLYMADPAVEVKSNYIIGVYNYVCIYMIGQTKDIRTRVANTARRWLSSH